VEQELHTFPGYPSTPLVFSKVCVAKTLVFRVVFVYHSLSFFFCQLLSVVLRFTAYDEQGSPHIIKTGRLDFSLSWLTGEVRENLGDFRKSIQILTFLSSLPHVPLPFTKTNVLHYDLKKDAINEFGIKLWTSIPVWVTFQEHGSPFMWILKKKYDYWWKTLLFLQKLGDFIEIKAKKSPTSPGLVSPDEQTFIFFLTNTKTQRGSFSCSTFELFLNFTHFFPIAIKPYTTPAAKTKPLPNTVDIPKQARMGTNPNL